MSYLTDPKFYGDLIGLALVWVVLYLASIGLSAWLELPR